MIYNIYETLVYMDIRYTCTCYHVMDVVITQKNQKKQSMTPKPLLQINVHFSVAHGDLLLFIMTRLDNLLYLYNINIYICKQVMG